jgi:2-polyprenyl-3-methyl-5-hydroxy-6-metoxy-1,4-benzoquinol methylase
MPAVAQYLPDAQSLAEERGIDLEVYQCSGCGLVQLRNEPVHYYKEVVRASGFSSDMKEFRLKQFGDFVQQNALTGKKIIEVGCGRGEYLSLIAQCGVQTYGLEYAENSVAECRKNGLTVYQGFVEGRDYRIEHQPFDAFFLGFLEHLPDPNSVLRGIYANLSDDAVGMIEVPNFDMILRNNLFSEFMRDHLFYFTKETLRTTLALSGFEIVSCTEIWYDYILSAVVRKRKKTDISSFQEHQDRIKGDLDDYINRFGSTSVATWGAGHQALALFCLFDLGGMIKYVIDSATFKQGKFTPATHVPIVSPDMLISDPAEAVIIMAGSYSDEIGKIMSETYPQIKHVAVLRESGLEIRV